MKNPLAGFPVSTFSSSVRVGTFRLMLKRASVKSRGLTPNSARSPVPIRAKQMK